MIQRNLPDFEIHVLWDNAVFEKHPLLRGLHYTIGTAADIKPKNHSELYSRIHCRIAYSEKAGCWCINDGRETRPSSGGTYVNRTRVRRWTKLNDCDIITLSKAHRAQFLFCLSKNPSECLFDDRPTGGQFAIYDYVDAGVFVISQDARSTILYCNSFFARYLSTTPADLTGRSFDEIIRESQPFSLHRKAQRQALSRKLTGGEPTVFYRQAGPRKGDSLWLNIYSLQAKSGQMPHYIGYCRRLTKLEYLIERSKLDERLDRLWKPVAKLFLSGSVRPFVLAASPLWMPPLLAYWPELAEFVQNLLTGVL